MSPLDSNQYWKSDYEVFTTPTILEIEKSWAETDTKIGNQAELKWGEEPQENSSILHKIDRRFRFESKKAISLFRFIIHKSIGRIYWKFQEKFNTVQGITNLPRSNKRLLVVPLPLSWGEVSTTLENTDADLIGFIKPTGKALKSGLNKIDDAISANPEIIVLHGESITSQGRQNFVPKDFDIYLIQKNLLRNFIIFKREALLQHSKDIETTSTNWLFRIVLGTKKN